MFGFDDHQDLGKYPRHIDDIAVSEKVNHNYSAASARSVPFARIHSAIVSDARLIAQVM